MEERRPADFVEMIRRARRGRLKLYLGASPGVGKTWRMLQEAHQLRARGVDVVVGLVETHGRAETAALVEGLEVLPRKRVAWRGAHTVEVEELDLEGLLARRPEVALVDELPHTNPPGFAHARRYEDVQALLDAGISVISAINVQHIASLQEVVQRSTGVLVRERVPDAFVHQADQIVSVDLAVEDVLERLQAGKIYAAERIPHAMEAFFQPDKLNALRELALREVAESLDRRQAAAERPSGAGKVAVALASASPAAAVLLQRGARLAGRLNTHWFVVQVSRPGDAQTMPADAQRRALDTLADAQRQGAEVVRLEGADVVEALLQFCRQRGVDHLIVGRSRRSAWERLWRGDPLGRLVQAAEEVDLHVVSALRAPEED